MKMNERFFFENFVNNKRARYKNLKKQISRKAAESQRLENK